MKLNTVQGLGNEVATTGRRVLQGMRHLAQHGSAKVAAAALATITAIACSDDGRVYGDTDTATSETAGATDTSSRRGADLGGIGAADAGSAADTAADLAGDVASASDVAVTPDTAADTSLDTQDGSTDAADAAAGDAPADTAPADTSADSSANLPDTTVVGGFDAATPTDSATADTAEVDIQTVQSKFWNNHPNAPKDEKLLGCESDELPAKQVVVPGGPYQIVKIPAGQSGLVDMAPDLLINQNGAQAYNVPPSEFPVNMDGRAYRIVGLQMQNPDQKVGTNLISVKKGTGELDRMPLFAVRSKVGQHAFDIATAVKGALAEDKFGTLSDVHDALAQKLPTDKFQVQGIVPGTPGKSDGQTFAGKEKGVVWVMPVANAQCTE